MRQNPVAADDSSIARGEQKFMKTCAPCHGKTLAGDGPVAAQFMLPPDLLAEPKVVEDAKAEFATAVPFSAAIAAEIMLGEVRFVLGCCTSVSRPGSGPVCIAGDEEWSRIE